MDVAASGVAIASIAIQLAGSLHKAYNFWSSIKEAPEDIHAISIELKLLSNVLAQIANKNQHLELDAILTAALEGCSIKVKTLENLLQEIEPDFASTSRRVRQWTAFKAVLKSGKVAKYQQALERLKSTLLLAKVDQDR